MDAPEHSKMQWMALWAAVVIPELEVSLLAHSMDLADAEVLVIMEMVPAVSGSERPYSDTSAKES